MDSPQGTYGSAFTYQGQLRDADGPVNGACDLRFRLFNTASGGSQVGGTLTQEGVGLVDGLFTARLDFGAAGRWSGHPSASTCRWSCVISPHLRWSWEAVHTVLKARNDSSLRRGCARSLGQLSFWPLEQVLPESAQVKRSVRRFHSQTVAGETTANQRARQKSVEALRHAGPPGLALPPT